MANDHEILRADIPSVGTFTAREISVMNAAVLGGRFIDAHRLEELAAVAFEGVDQIFGTPARPALGCPLGRARPTRLIFDTGRQELDACSFVGDELRRPGAKRCDGDEHGLPPPMDHCTAYGVR
ncbi:hypothetical protein [Streptomyces flaveolus]|uniref:hypothetical protein n=1 Tax=Streptomyces flaveolus TaxID=67297 RepID=UPI0036FF3BC1